MRSALTGILAAGVLAFPTSASAANPTTCEGYPEPRVFVESQSWWTDSDDVPPGGDMEHVHTGTCFPMDQTVSGNTTLDVVVKLHNSEGQSIKRVRVDVASNQDSQKRYETVPSGLRCDVPDCTFTVPVTVPTDQLGTGKWEWRVATEARPDPSSELRTNLATSGWQTCVRSCAGRTPKNPRKEGRGWYRRADNEVVGYVIGRFGWLAEHDAEYPWRRGAFQPVAGLWQPPVSIQAGSQTGVSEPHEYSQAYIDPNFHNGSEGVKVLDQPGTFRGRLAVDTTTLPNGLHKLVLVAATGDTFAGELRGVHVIPFVVDNAPPPIIEPLALGGS